MRMRLFALLIFSITSVASLTAGSTNGCPPVDSILWFGQPAVKWTEALPVGNGRLGAMVFGGVVDERIQFNEDTLWTGHPHDYANTNALAWLPKIRALLAAGKKRKPAD